VGSRYSDHGLIFARENGEPIPPQRVTERFRQLAVEAGLPRIRLHDLRHGQATIARANHYPAGILNGQTGRVVATHPENGSLVVRIGARDISHDAGYLTAGGPDHGYALTIHQAQGLTAGAALLLGGDHLYREAGYVALSRGRDHNATYLADRPDNLTDPAETTQLSRQPPCDLLR
jgi:ATP-dependent exoDNAse (exonuclease V) alpha subunit